MTEMPTKHWLMKAEPDSRIVKGKDVKFGVEDFESVQTTPWEGVRNAEARNIMKEMKNGDKVLFYHSNCKNPGIAAFAEVSKEAYPDYTAWDSTHPYFDAKTDKDNPKWYMVDVTFQSRAKHFIPLSFLRSIAALVDEAEAPEEVTYIGREGMKAIKEMTLVNRGRLSVQRVEAMTWDVIVKLADQGGWNETSRSSKPQAKTRKTGATSKSKANDPVQSGDETAELEGKAAAKEGKSRGRKRKADTELEAESNVEVEASKTALRRSTRARK